MGKLVLPILMTENSCGWHSCFQHGMNLQFGEDLLFIGDNLKGVVPFGIHLSLEDYQYIRKNVQYGVDQIQFNRKEKVLTIGNQKLYISYKKVYRDKIQSKTIQQSLQLLEVDLPLTVPGLSFDEELVQTQNDSDIVYQLIGRGLGLTPSGDDFLVGLMALNQQVQLLSHEFFSTLEKLLMTDCTTEVSKQYLKAALKKDFSSALINVLNSRSSVEYSQYVSRLLYVGSTSGRDMLEGILWGLLRLKSKK